MSVRWHISEIAWLKIPFTPSASTSVDGRRAMDVDALGVNGP